MCPERVNKMLRKKHHFLLFLANLILFSVIILLDTSELADISIKTATPMLILPLLCAYAFFSNSRHCLVVGLISGAFIDSVSLNAYCFNTIALMLLAVAVSLASNNLFNKNILSAAVLTLLTCGVYYILLWLLFYTVRYDMNSSLGYLLKYALPSAVYSTVFIFPFYYIYKKFNEIKER